MNERIKELADEARIKFSAHLAHEGVDTAVITRRDLNEFAELLISSVMTEVRDEVQYQFGWTLADIVTEQVKKEFGVK
jgi:hypothetical protein